MISFLSLFIASGRVQSQEGAIPIVSPEAVNASAMEEAAFGLKEFRAELQRLERISSELNLKPQAKICRSWIPLNTTGQQVLFLPDRSNDDELPGGDQVTLKSWKTHFHTARGRYANALYRQALEQVADNPQAAYHLLWHVLREDPEHQGAKQGLGTLVKAATIRPRLRRSRSVHPDLGWPAGSYSRIETPHFLLTTRAGARESLKLASQLESFFTLWSQVFYPLWAPPGTLQSRLTSTGSALSKRTSTWPRTRRIEVFMLKDREEYLRVLGVAEDNIGLSVGYYNPGAKKSFFYPANGMEATLFHELTHQLLLEATHIDGRVDAGTNRAAWMLEGIALYMESLIEQTGYWTVGGMESPRLQTARYRALRDGYWPNWKEFCEGGIDNWKANPEVARLYTHAAGLTHVMLDTLGEESRLAYFRSLVGVYQGQPSAESLLHNLGSDEELAKQRYRDALLVNDDALMALLDSGHQPRDLVLCASQLRGDSWQAIQRLTKLEWLDLSFSNVDDESLSWLPDAISLKRLSLEGTSITGRTLAAVANLPHLTELDLSQCEIDDENLRILRGNQSIRTLWLSNTKVTDASLAILGTLASLDSCAIDGTLVSPQSWRKFREDHPQIQD